MAGLSAAEKALEDKMKSNPIYCPPTVAPAFANQCIEIRELVDKNYEKIVLAAIKQAVNQSGVTPRIRTNTLADLCEKFLIPQVQKFEGGWGDHPNDSGGPTMRGVITMTFQGYYRKLFIEWPRLAGLGEIATKAEALAKNYPGIVAGSTRGEHVKGALYHFNSSHKVASMFIWGGLCAANTGYPIVVMSADAWLGYIQFEMCWGGGPGSVFGAGKAQFDVVAKNSYGRDAMGVNGWAKWVCNTLDPAKVPEFASACFASQVGFYDRISRAGSKNNVFRKGWFNRLINSPTSDLKMAIIVNEVFNKNGKSLFKFDEAETAFLLQKAKIYESLTINYPTGG
jgi:hypothetical protein